MFGGTLGVLPAVIDMNHFVTIYVKEFSFTVVSPSVHPVLSNPLKCDQKERILKVF
jgi:hypothetical protein